MKKKIFLLLAAMMVLGLGIATLAYTRAGGTTTAASAACCCCSGDSCPMKSKDGAAAKDAASCPMMSKDEAAKGGASCRDGCEHCAGAHAQGEHKMAGHHKGSDDKGEATSCPMMKNNKDAAVAVDAAAVASDDKQATSCSCPCCNAEKETVTVPSV